MAYAQRTFRTVAGASRRKFAVKLWNVGRFLSLNLGSLPLPPGSFVPPGERDIVDRWLLSHLAEAIDLSTNAFEEHDYMQAHQAAARMFWPVFCDRYLEMVKDRLAGPGADSARWTLGESFRALLGLFAPFAPFVTEHLYQRFYASAEGGTSLHLTPWPAADPEWGRDTAARSAVDQLTVILDATRVLRSSLRLGNSSRLRSLTVQAHTAPAAGLLEVIAEPLRLAARADVLVRGPAEHASGVDGITVAIAV